MPNSTSDSGRGSSPKEAIRSRAFEAGFDAVGFARAESPPGARENLEAYVAEGRHGEMEWMERTLERRADPGVLWPEAKTVIVLGVNYGPSDDPLALLARRDRGLVSVYARNADYHDVLKRQLKQFAGWLKRSFGGDVKIFVDTAPVMEKPLAQAAGIGWQGKHTNLVSRDFGSWLFLGAVFTTLGLPPDQRGSDACGSCSLCLERCPTGAFTGPYQIDARRCISYLTIEHKGHIPREFRESLGNRIYGCDDCLAVCPWNKFAVAARESAFHPRIELTLPLLGELAQLTDSDFRDFFRGSPVRRIGRDRFVRNVLIAIGNSCEPQLAPVAERLLRDESPVVRAMAVWAISRLLSPEEFARIFALHAPGEGDPAVAAEWTCGILAQAPRSTSEKKALHSE
ncbi:MAG TPA: tRNA epoxyqueuosine(34) reductase QueG [Micropepsaceae bacterium]|nr:tRNA epoxyqueuosine(34) reductase QueG [Micropepsaceae bacterium]